MQDMAAHSSARLTPNIIASNVLYDITKQEKESASHVENQNEGEIIPFYRGPLPAKRVHEQMGKVSTD